MAHDHRMNPVGEPHLNAARRQPQGRSDLPRLRANLTTQASIEMGAGPGGSDNIFVPSEDMVADIVSARLKNYRQDRNSGRASQLTRDTARALKGYIRYRNDFR